MSSRKRRPRGPRIITQDGPTQAVIGVRVPPEQIDAARHEGERAIESKIDAAVEQVRADAQALETTANVLRQVERFHDTARFLDGMAQGMRLAAGRMPDTCPF